MDYAAAILGRLPKGKRSTGLPRLISRLETYLPQAEVESIVLAFDFAHEAHQGQQRQTGEAYITHPVAVATILADLHLDSQTIKAALLHDVIEDTPALKEEISARFGSEVAGLVDGVSKLEKLAFSSHEEAQAASFRKMILAMVEDIRVILVKLADRCHNMQSLDALPLVKRRRIARETLEIYAPIANRLGINSIRLELQDQGFRHMHPQRYRVLERALKKAKGNQKQFVKGILQSLEQTLAKEGIEAKVMGREKHLYSIYRKMRSKSRSLAEIVDVFGFRIIVDQADTCYRALGIVHSLYKPMPGRFKDYIAIPRVNGYQSLHTTLFGPNSMPMEVQIRTAEMDRVAESGIAAHWQYKLGERGNSAPHTRAREWLGKLMEMQDGSNSEEFLESVKVDLFPDKVYVFTPKGEILRLPRGSTCVDFAYAVHTAVGDRCVAAKINRRLVPLRTHLRNGETVEIITAKGGHPNPAWMNFVATAKARTSIRHYLKKMQLHEAVDLGRRLLENALRDYSLSIRKVGKSKIQELAEELGLKESDELFTQIGLGERMAPLIARRLLTSDEADPLPTNEPLAISGTEGMVVTYARCCSPIPGDSIMGYLSTGRGIVIHRDDCGNLVEYRKQPERWINVSWKPRIDRDFNVEIRAEVVNRVGVLAAVAATISDCNSNIEAVSIDERDGSTSTLSFQVQVKNRAHLARVLRGIRAMKDVYRVARRTA
ncbi:MAG: bifunctional (p)ppGpp synthetase/guanosine-3',5'-bis(diphosphate) 3'-pyrophosphohydrolase [Gammaproteobacteria bacterium]|nr:bifunctional (p)ppGpp synthetase/guanosine-3',5'-bis(diphosphate) 3'-pyrophosphohydrolase [Gammaproteobacteria bacterium]